VSTKCPQNWQITTSLPLELIRKAWELTEIMNGVLVSNSSVKWNETIENILFCIARPFWGARKSSAWVFRFAWTISNGVI